MNIIALSGSEISKEEELCLLKSLNPNIIVFPNLK